LFHAWAKDGHHHLLERTEESFVVLAQHVVCRFLEYSHTLLFILLSRGIALPWQQHPGHLILQVRDATSIFLEGQQAFLLELVYGVLELLLLLGREILKVDVHDVRDVRHLDLFGCCPTERAKTCVDAKRAPGAKHTASRTKLASHAQRVTRRASQFFLKINKR
jgi:hypothetical protein